MKKYCLMVNTPYLLEELTEGSSIFDTFVIQDKDNNEYKQVEVPIKPNLNKLELIINCLLKEIKYICNNADKRCNRGSKKCNRGSLKFI